MARAFIVVETAPGSAESIQGTIDEMESIVEADVVAGDYDLVVEAESGEVHDVLRTVSTEIRSLPSVTDTKTYVCLE